MNLTKKLREEIEMVATYGTKLEGYRYKDVSKEYELGPGDVFWAYEEYWTKWMPRRYDYGELERIIVNDKVNVIRQTGQIPVYLWIDVALHERRGPPLQEIDEWRYRVRMEIQVAIVRPVAASPPVWPVIGWFLAPYVGKILIGIIIVFAIWLATEFLRVLIGAWPAVAEVLPTMVLTVILPTIIPIIVVLFLIGTIMRMVVPRRLEGS